MIQSAMSPATQVPLLAVSQETQALLFEALPLGHCFNLEILCNIPLYVIFPPAHTCIHTQTHAVMKTNLAMGWMVDGYTFDPVFLHALYIFIW